MTVAYGEYLSQMCTTCHGVNLNGGTIRDFNGEPAVALNLTPGGKLAGWSETEFINAMRSGMTPDGRKLSEAMLWRYTGQMLDEELQAIWLYLQTLPPLEQGLERTDL